MANRNEELMDYGIPTIEVPRYKHSTSLIRDTSFNLGEITPIYASVLVQPGDTISMGLRSFIKLGTSIVPATGNLCVDIFAFADDWQNEWEHTKEFWGEDTLTPFDVNTEYTVPQIIIEAKDEVGTHDIVHHLQYPYMPADTTGQRFNLETTAMLYRSYCRIYNEYFRDQNYIEKIKISKGDEDTKYSELPVIKLLKAARLHDYFSGIPEAQKGGAVNIPIGKEAPVVGNGKALGLTGGTLSGNSYQDYLATGTGSTLKLGITENNTPPTASTPYNGSGIQNPNNWIGLTTIKNNSGVYADLSNAVAATINALRMATAEQHIREMFAWYGSRFQNVIRTGWGVNNAVSAAEMRIPEYLGGHRFWLNMDTVLATTEGTNQPLGDSAGYSTTADEQFLFTKSFSTWQNVIILCVVRQQHVYSQGVQNQYQKKRKYDFFWKEFEGIGAQARKVSEIMVTGTDKDNDTWNFAPPWQEYRMEQSRATGLMAPNAPQNLSVYNYGDKYETVPNAGKEWIEETPDYLDRTLVIPSTKTDQFIANFEFDIEKTSIVRNYVLPGIDKL